MTTLQALWTQARENLDVNTVIYSNRSYAILNIEMARAGFHSPGPRALSLFDLSRPSLDWVKLAAGMGRGSDPRRNRSCVCRSVRLSSTNYRPAPH